MLQTMLLGELSNPIVRGLHRQALAPHDLVNRVGKFDVRGVEVMFERYVLAPFAFFENAQIVVADERVAKFDPAVVQLATQAARFRRLGA